MSGSRIFNDVGEIIEGYAITSYLQSLKLDSSLLQTRLFRQCLTFVDASMMVASIVPSPLCSKILSILAGLPSPFWSRTHEDGGEVQTLHRASGVVRDFPFVEQARSARRTNKSNLSPIRTHKALGIRKVSLVLNILSGICSSLPLSVFGMAIAGYTVTCLMQDCLDWKYCPLIDLAKRTDNILACIQKISRPFSGVASGFEDQRMGRSKGLCAYDLRWALVGQ
jgi:hypothetical protein